MLIEYSLSITIACIIMTLIGIIWAIDIIRIAFADNVDKITKIVFNGLKWTFILTLLWLPILFVLRIILYIVIGKW